MVLESEPIIPGHSSTAHKSPSPPLATPAVSPGTNATDDLQARCGIAINPLPGLVPLPVMKTFKKVRRVGVQRHLSRHFLVRYSLIVRILISYSNEACPRESGLVVGCGYFQTVAGKGSSTQFFERLFRDDKFVVTLLGDTSGTLLRVLQGPLQSSRDMRYGCPENSLRPSTKTYYEHHAIAPWGLTQHAAGAVETLHRDPLEHDAGNPGNTLQGFWNTLRRPPETRRRLQETRIGLLWSDLRRKTAELTRGRQKKLKFFGSSRAVWGFFVRVRVVKSPSSAWIEEK